MLVRRGEAEIPDSARRSFRLLAERLNRWTLIEFKSPVDTLGRGDLGRLLGISHLFEAQQPENIPASEMSRVILAPSLSSPFATDARHLGSIWWKMNRACGGLQAGCLQPGCWKSTG